MEYFQRKYYIRIFIFLASKSQCLFFRFITKRGSVLLNEKFLLYSLLLQFGKQYCACKRSLNFQFIITNKWPHKAVQCNSNKKDNRRIILFLDCVQWMENALRKLYWMLLKFFSLHDRKMYVARTIDKD